MWISGSRLITINGEDQLITISGVIRPSDVRPDNNVYSYNISDAKIVFDGSGMIDRAQKPGWLTRLFHWLF
jgi:flagellar L-ring protein precursor FlgH